jgi:hypothetical protein
MYPALCKTLLPEINLHDRESEAASEIISKQYWEQLRLCKNLDRPYIEAGERYLDAPNNLKVQKDFQRVSKEVMRQQDRLNFWREHLRGESKSPVQLPVTQRSEELDGGHSEVVVLGSKPINIPTAKGKKLQRIEELNLGNEPGEAVLEPPEPKGLRPAKGNAKLHVQSRLAELRSGQDKSKPAFAGPKPIDLCSAKGLKPVVEEPETIDPHPANEEKPVYEASKPIDIRSNKGMKKVRFALPVDEGRQVRFAIPRDEEREF